MCREGQAWSRATASREPTAAIGEIGEVVTDLDDSCGHVLRRLRIEVFDVPANSVNVGHSRKSPDNPPQRLGMGQGNSSGVPQDLSHFTTSSCHESTGCNVSLGLGDRARLGVLVNLKDGFGLGHKNSPTEFSVFPFSALET
jgi:hypothetical protein